MKTERYKEILDKIENLIYDEADHTEELEALADECARDYGIFKVGDLFSNNGHIRLIYDVKYDYFRRIYKYYCVKLQKRRGHLSLAHSHIGKHGKLKSSLFAIYEVYGMVSDRNKKVGHWPKKDYEEALQRVLKEAYILYSSNK